MDQLTDELVAFRDAREWGRFHNLPSLASALNVEAGELLDLFLWNKEPSWDDVALEVADVLIFALYICRELGVSPESIVRRKMALNAEKYPVEQWRGRAW